MKGLASVERKYAEALGPAWSRPVPKLRRHRTHNLAYCAWKVRGRRRWAYFGRWGSPEARERYAEFARLWPAQLDEQPPA